VKVAENAARASFLPDASKSTLVHQIQATLSS
jgi:hypothetical protein